LHQPRRVSSMQDEDYKTRKPRQMCGRAAWEAYKASG
jgi:hypothetical protein